MIHERQFRRDGGVRSLYRACVLRAIREKQPGAANPWADDPVVELILRAAQQPTTLADTPELQGVIVEFVAALAPQSAAADLFRLATSVSFGNAARIVVPGLTGLPEADWIREGAPFPVVRAASAGVVLSPYKMGTIVALTNEMMRSSSAEAVIRQGLLDKLGPSLDRYLFDDQPGVPGLRPPGILNGVDPTPPSQESNKSEAMVNDFEELIGQLSPYGGNGGIAIVSSAKRAVRLKMRGFMEGRSPFPLLVSTALTDRIVAVATNALAVAYDPPVIDAGGEVVLHMEDTNPQPIVGDGGALAVPVRSTWQTDSTGLRFRLPVSWMLRAPAVAWMTPSW